MNGLDQLRGRLWAETRPHHQRVDDAFGALDISNAAGLACFLAAQLNVVQALLPDNGPDRAEAAALAADMASAMSADLHALGVQPAVSLAPYPVDATAMLYVLLGSRMGTRLLARRWQLAADDDARLAGRYLSLDPQTDRWRALCARLMAQSAAGAVGDAMVAQVIGIFDLYSTALDGVFCAAKGHADA